MPTIGRGRQLFTSESVTEGHPDKVADQIVDAILDAILEKDKMARVACECLVKTGFVLVAGEISTECYVEMPDIVRDTLRRIGYTRAKFGFDADTCAVLTAIEDQSPDIALGVDRSLESKLGEMPETLGAGDQGLMFGYACDETDVYMPISIHLAHRLARRLSHVRHQKILPYLRPDGKTQVTIEYHDGEPVRVHTVVVSAQHASDVPLSQIREDIIEHVIKQTIPSHLMDDNTRILVNATGRFVVGGPQGDSGLSGRKIIVDTYGGFARHGGGSFSGKDPTKVDRSGSYAARYVAKNVVAAGLARECEVQVAYVIGVAQPVSIHIDTKGTAEVFDEAILEAVKQTFDFRPGAIIERFDLRRPIYSQVSCYGHFGREDLDLPWEQLDLKDDLLKHI
ncbi:MAG TPA: methionine adenosyltransferase [Bacillota bacterium]|jgi:S-adenosylmethionine synthetase|nr:methionine adenosyltransferase [Candidatus Fermentithermobacillaceae bacterium]HOP70211.1 methionine adenosyltransferase [Bacillota bacterium]HPZ84756.1 methionine adenosyltransferase [Bacillota bacterium]